MLSTGLRSLQLDLSLHRRWLSGFLQRTQATRFSATVHHLAPLEAQNRERSDGHGRAAQKKTRSRGHPSSPSLNFRKTGGAHIDRPRVNPIIADIREKVREGNIGHVIENYGALNDRDTGTLEPRDVRQIAQCLHHNVRTEKQSAVHQGRQSQVRDLVDFAAILVQDIMSSKLAPSWKANLHLIGIFKESGYRGQGVEFWQWLVTQDEPLLSVDCYGAAIELLSADGTPLSELEKLYEEALGRFPGSFAAYHLSPHAVLPDREQAFTIGGIPISLLQGILTARLLSGDVRSAYLALDTALRILPDQVPSRLFALFLDERPLEEAYAVFALACKGGNVVLGAYYRSMLGTIRRHTSLSTPVEQALGLRAMLSATYMFLGTGGSVAGNSVNEVVIAATQFLRVDGVTALRSKDKQKIVKGVMEIVRGLFEVFARYGAKPSIPAFNSIITNLGGFGSSKQTIGIALKDADALGLAPTDVTWRSILAVSGMFQDRALVEKTWAHLRDLRIESAENPSAGDLHALVKPAHLAGAIDFAQAELDKFRDVIEPTEYETLLERLHDPREAEMHSTENVEPADLDAMLTEIENVKTDIELIKARTEGSPTVQDFSEQALPMTLQPLSSNLLLPDSQMRKIYDEFTANPDKPAVAGGSEAASSQPPATSKTRMPFAALRYESWKMINTLMRMAEENDGVYHQRVDEAIAGGRVPPKRKAGLVAEGKEVVSWGLSSLLKDVRRSEVDDEEFERVRKEIKRLRSSRPGA